MRHVSGWGINEVHGLAVDQSGTVMLGTGVQATVYSPCARLTIQKLLVDRDDPDTGAPNPVLASLVWDGIGKEWSGEGLVNPPIFNKAVWAAGDGPDYYSAEINVKGKIIYGYTWDVRKLNDFTVNEGEADGDYRITFSFDESCGTAMLNTFFESANAETGDPGTQLLLPIEEEEVSILEEDEGGDTGGANAVIDYDNNLTYIDVRILERTGGGGGGGNAGGKGDDTAKKVPPGSSKIKHDNGKGKKVGWSK